MVSSIRAMAISETTRDERSQVWLEAPVTVRTPSFRLSIKLVRKAANAGARLQAAPVARARRRANVATVASMEMESTRGMDSGNKCNAVRMAAAANAKPSR